MRELRVEIRDCYLMDPEKRISSEDKAGILREF
jgi:hypothetical protein